MGRRIEEIAPLRGLPAPVKMEKEGWSGTVSVDRSGHTADAHLVAVALSHDEPPGHQLLLVDRTHEVAQEREIERQARLATLGEALAGVAHELNNPLTTILGWCELALEPGQDAGEMRDGLGTIQHQATRMRDLVRELLGFSRSGAQDGRTHLNELVARVLRMQRMTRGKRSSSWSAAPGGVR